MGARFFRLIIAAGMLSLSVPASLFGQGEVATAGEVLDGLHRKAFEWFREYRHPKSGQVLDRGANGIGASAAGEGGEERRRRGRMASIAATGYFLSLLPDWVKLGWLTEAQAREQALVTIDFAARMPHHRGLLYHFQDWESGARWAESEVSSLDSAIFFNGCIVVAEAFGGEVAERANALVDRAEWDQFLTRHPKTGKELLSLGWTPEKGLLYPADVRASEMAMPYFLAVGSRTHPIAARLWYETDVVRGRLGGVEVLNPTHPLFTSYYGLGWHDLKGLVDREGVDLWGNARDAAVANREVCRQLARRYRTYGEEAGGWWGLSAGDSPAGYVAPNPLVGDADGTVWPVATLAALPWMPELEREVMAWRASRSWGEVEGKYGLSPFTLEKGWVGPDLLGIDLGSFAVCYANYRRGTVWELWMRHPVAKGAVGRLGYRGRESGGHCWVEWGASARGDGYVTRSRAVAHSARCSQARVGQECPTYRGSGRRAGKPRPYRTVTDQRIRFFARFWA